MKTVNTLQAKALPDNDSDEVYRDANTPSGPEGPATMLMFTPLARKQSTTLRQVALANESINQDDLTNRDRRQGKPPTEPHLQQRLDTSRTQI
jgi:hypothetical protein